MDARDEFFSDRDCHRTFSECSTWRAWHGAQPAENAPATRLNVAQACKALVKMNGALRSTDLEPGVRKKMERARRWVRRELALHAR